MASPTTLEKVKSQLGITDNSQDAALTNLINVYTTMFERMTGRKWGLVNSFVEKGAQTWGQKRLTVNQHCPIGSINSIKINGEEVDSDTYEIEDKNLGFIRVKTGAWESTGWARGNTINRYEYSTEYLYEIDYAGGEEMPADVEQAIIDSVITGLSKAGTDSTISSIKVGDASTSFGSQGAQSGSVFSHAGLPASFTLAVMMYKTTRVI